MIFILKIHTVFERSSSGCARSSLHFSYSGNNRQYNSIKGLSYQPWVTSLSGKEAYPGGSCAGRFNK